MKFSNNLAVAVLLVTLGVGCLATPFNSGQRLLVIMLDGFRHDYLTQQGLELPAFTRMAREGGTAKGFIPAFPSLSLPNYYSIMTGLHTESHGITGNFMYDKDHEDSFALGTNPDHVHPHWWDKAEPLWISAKKQGIKSHMWYWRGCEVEIRGQHPDYCLPYAGIPSMNDFKSAINSSLDLLEAGETQLAAIYYENTDHLGHVYGPFSAELNTELVEVDKVIGKLLDQFSKPALRDVNLIILSDHGMSDISPKRLIDLRSIIKNWDPADGLTAMNNGALISLYTAPGREERVYRKLKGVHPNLKVYRRSDLPWRWHYELGPYIPPVTGVADILWHIVTPDTSATDIAYLGYHGYDTRNTPEMHGIFFAWGPAFLPGSTVEAMPNVDAYQVMCHVLDIDAQPNNGTWTDVQALVITNVASSVTSLSCLTSLALSVVYILVFSSF